MGRTESIAGRMAALGAIVGFCHYVRPDETYGSAAAHVLADALRTPLALAVIDGVTEAMTSQGLDPLSNPDTAASFAPAFVNRVITYSRSAMRRTNWSTAQHSTTSHWPASTMRSAAS
jgi:hypothetical protein